MREESSYEISNVTGERVCSTKEVTLVSAHDVCVCVCLSVLGVCDCDQKMSSLLFIYFVDIVCVFVCVPACVFISEGAAHRLHL